MRLNYKIVILQVVYSNKNKGEGSFNLVTQIINETRSVNSVDFIYSPSMNQHYIESRSCTFYNGVLQLQYPPQQS